MAGSRNGSLVTLGLMWYLQQHRKQSAVGNGARLPDSLVKDLILYLRCDTVPEDMVGQQLGFAMSGVTIG